MKLLRNYIWWSYERGSFHYDVMVTLILLFLFVSPHFIDYRDRPVPDLPQHNNQVLVREMGTANGVRQYAYEVRTGRLVGDTSTDEGRRAALLQVIQPIAGNVQIDHYEPVTDPHGSVVAYTAWVNR